VQVITKLIYKITTNLVHKLVEIGGGAGGRDFLVLIKILTWF